MKVKLPLSEWTRIVSVIFIFSMLAAIFTGTGLSSIKSDVVFYVMRTFAIIFPAYLISAIPFHLYAIGRAWNDNEHQKNSYLAVGFFLGTFLYTLFILCVAGANLVSGLGQILFAGILFGGAGGYLCSYSFFTFIVSQERKDRFFVVLLWCLLSLPVLSNIVFYFI